MSKQENGGPAFPLPSPATYYSNKDGWQPTTEIAGMTLRDYFAAKALQGICAAENHLDRVGSFKAAAGMAYELADAMLKARGEQQ